MKKILLLIISLLTTTLAFSQAGDFTFIHTSTAANNAGYGTFIDHPDLNGNPNAKILITHNLNGDGSVDYNNTVTGLYYSTADAKWSIVNEAAAPITESTSYNVYVAGTEGNIVSYTATGGAYFELVDIPGLNNNPNAKPIISSVWTVAGGYNNGNYGFDYSNGDNKWWIYNEDLSTAIPTDAVFNILVEPALVNYNPAISFVHQATAGTITGNYTVIDHPLLNGNPDAVFVLSHVFNHPDAPGSNVSCNHTLGTWYSTSAQKWTIFTEDVADFPVNAAFSIAIQLPQPENDDANGAIPLTVEPYGTGCNSPVTISNVGATDSSGVNGVPTCGSYAGGDVWYYFEAPATGEVKVFRSDLGNWGALGYAIYETPSSNSAIHCNFIPEFQTSNSSYIGGLTPGVDYGIRIWEWNNNDFGDEEICLREWDHTASIAENVIEGFQMYPNPAEDIVNLSADTKIDQVVVYNTLGQKVMETMPAKNATQIDISNLDSGVYMLKVHADNQVAAYQLIVE